MKVVNSKCPNCGAPVDVSNRHKSLRCNYCNSDLILDIRLVTPQREVKKMIETGDDFFEAEDYKEAYYEFLNASKIDKDNEELKFNIAVCSILKNYQKNESRNINYVFDEFKKVYKDADSVELKEKYYKKYTIMLCKLCNSFVSQKNLVAHAYWKYIDKTIEWSYKLYYEVDLTKNMREEILKFIKSGYDCELSFYETDRFVEGATSTKLQLENKIKDIDKIINELK